jgi:hypothetical protein
MTCGMVTSMGVGALTKKLGGYENTKVRQTNLKYSILQSISNIAN